MITFIGSTPNPLRKSSITFSCSFQGSRGSTPLPPESQEEQGPGHRSALNSTSANSHCYIKQSKARKRPSRSAWRSHSLSSARPSQTLATKKGETTGESRACPWLQDRGSHTAEAARRPRSLHGPSWGNRMGFTSPHGHLE